MSSFDEGSSTGGYEGAPDPEPLGDAVVASARLDPSCPLVTPVGLNPFDAIIIGAGPAGSTAAILLARAGWSVALVEKQAFPRRKVCGECVAASNLPLLDALGIGAAFAAAAGPELRHVELMHRENCVRAELPAAADPRHGWGRALGRETLDPLLLERARECGAHIFQPYRVRAVDGEAGAWNCHLQGRNHSAPQILSAPLLIDAHGSWEALDVDHRRGDGEPDEHGGSKAARNDSDLFAFKANFRDGKLAPGVLPVMALDGGYGGIVVADGGVTTLACCVRRDRLDALRAAMPGLPAGVVVEAWLKRECTGVATALDGATREESWLSAGPLKPGIRLQASDSIFRIGNAAAEAHPIIGEGMSMALQSAWMLCVRLLAADRRVADWQAVVARSYARQWRRQFAPRMHLAALFAHLAMRPITAASLLALARAWPGLLTHGASRSGKLSSVVATDSFPLTFGASR